MWVRNLFENQLLIINSLRQLQIFRMSLKFTVLFYEILFISGNNSLEKLITIKQDLPALRSSNKRKKFPEAGEVLLFGQNKSWSLPIPKGQVKERAERLRFGTNEAKPVSGKSQVWRYCYSCFNHLNFQLDYRNFFPDYLQTWMPAVFLLAFIEFSFDVN